MRVPDLIQHEVYLCLAASFLANSRTRHIVVPHDSIEMVPDIEGHIVRRVEHVLSIFQNENENHMIQLFALPFGKTPKQ